MHHAGQLHVHGPFQRSIHFARDVVALDGSPHHAQLVDRLHGGLAGGGIDVATGERDVEAPAANQFRVGHLLRGIGLQRDGRVRHSEQVNGYAQVLATQFQQYPPRFRTDPAHGEAIALHTIGTTGAALIRGDVRAAHDEAGAVVGDVQFVADHLPIGGAGSLAAIGLANKERRRVVGVDHDPGVELQEVGIGIRSGYCGFRGNSIAAGQGDHSHREHQRTGPLQEIPSRSLVRACDGILDRFRQLQRGTHFDPPAVAPRTTRLIAACTR